LPPGAEPEALADVMAGMTAMVEKYQKAIGRKDISGEDIDAELGRAIGKLLGFETPTKHRFDIDKID
jgi:hypothetical protein